MNNRKVIEAFEGEFHRYRRLCEKAMAQVSDQAFYCRLNPMQNSISVIVQHMQGDMVACWTHFVSGDGRRHHADRGEEFVERMLERDVLMALWHHGWQRVFDTLEMLTDGDLNDVVRMRNEPTTIAIAVAKQLAHYAWHAGQIALIAKHFVGDGWHYLTPPPRRFASRGVDMQTVD